MPAVEELAAQRQAEREEQAAVDVVNESLDRFHAALAKQPAAKRKELLAWSEPVLAQFPPAWRNHPHMRPAIALAISKVLTDAAVALSDTAKPSQAAAVQTIKIELPVITLQIPPQPPCDFVAVRCPETELIERWARVPSPEQH